MINFAGFEVHPSHIAVVTPIEPYYHKESKVSGAGFTVKSITGDNIATISCDVIRIEKSDFDRIVINPADRHFHHSPERNSFTTDKEFPIPYSKDKVKFAIESNRIGCTPVYLYEEEHGYSLPHPKRLDVDYGVNTVGKFLQADNLKMDTLPLNESLFEKGIPLQALGLYVMRVNLVNALREYHNA